MKSNIPIWKCAWCGKRKGKVTENEIELLESFLHQFGWTLEPLVFHEDGMVYAHCQLPALREATSGLRRENSLVPAVPADDAALNSDGLSGKGERAVAGCGSDTAIEAGVGLIEQHDEWLRDRGWYDIITARWMTTGGARVTDTSMSDEPAARRMALIRSA